VVGAIEFDEGERLLGAEVWCSGCTATRPSPFSRTWIGCIGDHLYIGHPQYTIRLLPLTPRAPRIAATASSPAHIQRFPYRRADGPALPVPARRAVDAAAARPYAPSAYRLITAADHRG
jgi:hypothetical protein